MTTGSARQLLNNARLRRSAVGTLFAGLSLMIGPSISSRASWLRCVKLAVLAGLGVALLPTFIIGGAVQAGRLRAVLRRSARTSHLRGLLAVHSSAREGTCLCRFPPNAAWTGPVLGSAIRRGDAVGWYR